jgi:FixJ family two-component response regulator
MPATSVNIAVVDDDPSVRKALVRLFYNTQYRPQAYASAGEFLANLAAEFPQCLIVDFHMPQMTGVELQTHLTKNNIRIPTIVITANDEPGKREQCLAAGARFYLQKPVHRTVLLDAIGSIVGGRGVDRPS